MSQILMKELFNIGLKGSYKNTKIGIQANCTNAMKCFGNNIALASLSTNSNDFKGILPISTLSDEEKMFKETVSKLAKEKIQPLAKAMDESGRLDPRYLDILFSNGLMGIEIDSKYGGAGSSFFMSILAIEELAKADPVAGGIVDVQNTVVNSLMRAFGNEKQKEKYLPLLATKHFASFCLSEPESGSDAFNLKTTAEKQGDFYVLNGTKRWISLADVAGTHFVLANANPSVGYKGITCFIVDGGTPGFNITRIYGKLGLKGQSTCEITLDNVKVPENNILGKVGEGYKCAISILNEGRIGIAAHMLGIAEACLDIAIPYTLERKQFGQRIYDFQGLNHQIAHIATQVECVKLLVYNTARKRESKQPIVKEAAMAKYFASEVAQITATKCIDWMGGVAFTTDYPLEKFYRDVKAGTIFEGTSNIQLNTIAKCIGQEYSSLK